MSKEKLKVIISGGGTGGHIFPAIAIARELQAQVPEVEILFVGAEGRMEMEKVPQNGFQIVGLPIAGLQRGVNFSSFKKNLTFPLGLFKSLWKARKVVQDFAPDIVVGVGGYASGPVLWMAQMLGIPTLIQEQNSFAGITNKLLAKKAKVICTAYAGMEKFFPASKIVLTGNPVRTDIAQAEVLKLPAMFHFKLGDHLKTILVIGGSLGARTINEAIAEGLPELQKHQIQLIWQTGKTFYSTAEQLCTPKGNSWGEAKAYPFIQEMHLAYAAADLVISRAGALSISELCLVGKPCVLVPSPNVSEDHQTQNAMALVRKEAAYMVRDAEAKETLVSTAIALLQAPEKCQELKKNIKALGKPNATQDIVKQILMLISKTT